MRPLSVTGEHQHPGVSHQASDRLQGWTRLRSERWAASRNCANTAGPNRLGFMMSLVRPRSFHGQELVTAPSSGAEPGEEAVAVDPCRASVSSDRMSHIHVAPGAPGLVALRASRGSDSGFTH